MWSSHLHCPVFHDPPFSGAQKVMTLPHLPTPPPPTPFPPANFWQVLWLAANLNFDGTDYLATITPYYLQSNLHILVCSVQCLRLKTFQFKMISVQFYLFYNFPLAGLMISKWRRRLKVLTCEGRNTQFLRTVCALAVGIPTDFM